MKTPAQRSKPKRAPQLTAPPMPDVMSPGANSYTPPMIAGGGSMSGRVRQYNRWRERYNPLRSLTISRAVTLLESYQLGEMADPQWTYFFVEQSDADLFAILERREAALLELDWNVKLMSGRWAKSDPRLKTFDAGLADEQSAALREAFDGVDNLEEAFSHLQLATFRGYSHLEKYRNPDGDIYHLELVDQWNMVRDLLRGQWKYNPDALQTTFYYLPQENLIDPANFIVRERDRHVNRIALLKFIRSNLCDKDWDAFIEIYGIPSGVVIGPAGVQPGKEAEYQKAASDIAEGGSGYLPYGSDYKPNDHPRGDSPFRVRLDYLSEKLVLAGTGGLLTMLAQSGSGTLAGGAHMEAFQSIARAEAKKISGLFQRQFDAEVLDAKFPGRPHLVYFEIAANDELDPNEIADQAQKLSVAGYRIDTEQLSERTGYTLHDAQPETEENDEPRMPNDDPEKDPSSKRGKKPVANRRVTKRLQALAETPETEFAAELAKFEADFPAFGKLLTQGEAK